MSPDARAVAGYGPVVARRRGVPSIDEAVRELVTAQAGSGSHLDCVVVALKVAAAAERLARSEVMAAREFDRASWTDVGQALGVSRQTAHERFRTGPDGLHSRLFKRSPVKGRG